MLARVSSVPDVGVVGVLQVADSATGALVERLGQGVALLGDGAGDRRQLLEVGGEPGAVVVDERAHLAQRDGEVLQGRREVVALAVELVGDAGEVGC